MKLAISGVIALLVIAALAAGATWERSTTPTGIPACPTEDSTNCFWDSARSGNGLGQSFVDVNGVLYVEVAR